MPLCRHCLALLGLARAGWMDAMESVRRVPCRAVAWGCCDLNTNSCRAAKPAMPAQLLRRYR